jgi:hypothetical protein
VRPHPPARGAIEAPTAATTTAQSCSLKPIFMASPRPSPKNHRRRSSGTL